MIVTEHETVFAIAEEDEGVVAIALRPTIDGGKKV
jgi:hypothetical protein